jgi:hypothetical protein
MWTLRLRHAALARVAVPGRVADATAHATLTLAVHAAMASAATATKSANRTKSKVAPKRSTSGPTQNKSSKTTSPAKKRSDADKPQANTEMVQPTDVPPRFIKRASFADRQTEVGAVTPGRAGLGFGGSSAFRDDDGPLIAAGAPVTSSWDSRHVSVPLEERRPNPPKFDPALTHFGVCAAKAWHGKGVITVKCAFNWDRDKRRYSSTAVCSVTVGEKTKEVEFTGWDWEAMSRRALLKASRLSFVEPVLRPPHIGAMSPSPVIVDDLLDKATGSCLDDLALPSLRIIFADAMPAVKGTVDDTTVRDNEFDLASFVRPQIAGKRATLYLDTKVLATTANEDGTHPLLSTLGAYFLVLERGCTSLIAQRNGIAATSADRSAAATEVHQLSDAKIDISPGAPPTAALARLLLATYGEGYEIEDKEPKGGVFQATVMFHGRNTADGRGREPIGVGVGNSKKHAQRNAVLNALQLGFPRHFELLRNRPGYAAEPLTVTKKQLHAHTQGHHASVESETVPPFTFLAPSRRGGGRVLERTKDTADGAEGDVAFLTESVRQHHHQSQPPFDTKQATLSEAHPSPELLLRETLRSVNNADLVLLHEAQPAVVNGDSDWTWRTSAMAAKDGETTTLSCVRHTSTVTGSILACVKALRDVYPDDFALHKNRLPAKLAEIDAVLNDEIATEAPQSELARMRTAVGAAVADSFGDDVIKEDVAGSECTLTLGSTKLVVVHGPSGLVALHAAYRFLLASPLLDTCPPESPASLSWQRDRESWSNAPLFDSIVAHATGRSEHLDFLSRGGFSPRNGEEMGLEALMLQRYGARVTVAIREHYDRFDAEAFATTGNSNERVSLCRVDGCQISSQAAAMSALEAELRRAYLPDIPQTAHAVTIEKKELTLSDHSGHASAHGVFRKMLADARNITADSVRCEIEVQRHKNTGEILSVQASLIDANDQSLIAEHSREPADNGAVLSEISNVYEAALRAAGPSAWSSAEPVLEAAAQLGQSAVMIQRGPALYATFLTARVHGLQLQFHVRQLTGIGQHAWEAEAQLECASAHVHPLFAPQIAEVAMKQSSAISLGFWGRGDTKKLAVAKAANRFLESCFAAEYKNFARKASKLFENQQSADNETMNANLLRRDRERFLEERRLMIEVKQRERESRTHEQSPREQKRSFAQPRKGFGKTTTAQRDVDSPTSFDTVLEGTWQSEDAAEEDAGDQQIATRGQPTAGSGRRGAVTLEDVLRTSHRANTGSEVRIAFTRASGGWNARACSLHRRTDGTFDFASEAQLGNETAASKNVATAMLCYVLLQRLYPEDLVAAVEQHSNLLESLL